MILLTLSRNADSVTTIPLGGLFVFLGPVCGKPRIVSVC